MITFYRIKNNSPNVRKVSMMLTETGIPHQVQFVERTDSGQLAEAYRTVNPNLTVPAIVDNSTGAILFESAAILCYLAEQSGKLLPNNPQQRGEALNWLIFEAANVGPVVGEMFYYIMHDTDALADSHMQRYKDRLTRYCEILEQRLADREYLCGEFSIADIALYPWTSVMEDMAEIELSQFPNLSAWATRVGQRPSSQLD